MSGSTIGAFLLLIGALLVYWSLREFGVLKETTA
jgi:hypothetical protein